MIQKRIYALMKEKNLCQAQVVRDAGIDVKLFNAMLRGRKLIRTEHILPICRALKCEPNDLFAEQDEYEH